MFDWAGRPSPVFDKNLNCLMSLQKLTLKGSESCPFVSLCEYMHQHYVSCLQLMPSLFVHSLHRNDGFADAVRDPHVSLSGKEVFMATTTSLYLPFSIYFLCSRSNSHTKSVRVNTTLNHTIYSKQINYIHTI